MTPENKAESATSFPRLKLESQEVARVVCIEGDPLYEYIHNLRAPHLEGGRPSYEQVQKRNSEETEARMKYDFIGRPICLGDYATIEAKGSDPDNCPVCALAIQGDYVPMPERRFAMHILKYAVQPGTTNLQVPFSVQCVVWAFSDKTFNKLADFQTEFGDIRQKDLKLGPCVNVGFQTFDINLMNTAAWLSTQENKAYAASAYRENQAKDLSAFCGRRADRAFLQQDLNTILERYRIAFGGTVLDPAAEALLAPASPAIDVASILDGTTPAMPEPTSAAAELDSLLTGVATVVAQPQVTQPVAPMTVADAVPVVAQPAPAVEAPPVAAPVTPVVSVDDLLPSTAPQVTSVDELLSMSAPVAAAPAAQPAAAPATTFDDLVNTLS
jgi:hypothetical protein